MTTPFIGAAENLPLTQLNTFHKNPRRGDVEAIKGSLVANGQYRPIVVNKGTHTGRPYEVLAGNHTLMAYRELAEENPDKWGEIACYLIDVDDDRANRIVLADNRTADLGGYDTEQLLDLLDTVDYDLDGTGYDYDDLQALLETGELAAENPLDDNALGDDGTNIGEDTTSDDVSNTGSVADRLLVFPATVLDSTSGHWLARKQMWKRAGIDGASGRDEKLVFTTPINNFINWYDVRNEARIKEPAITDEEIIEKYAAELKPYNQGGGTSIFDPVLAEILTLWFSNPGDTVLDPWAGGAVRGLVATTLGRHYHGHELRQEQVEENQNALTAYTPPTFVENDQYATTATNIEPQWITGDSRQTMAQWEDESHDMILACPPYYDLETYGDDAADLSNLTTAEFDKAMADTLRIADTKLKPNRFACFVVGAARNNKGDLRDMKTLMVNSAPKGWQLANDAILLTSVGYGRLVAERQFNLGRSLFRRHQDVLVFVKGDRKTAAKRLQPVTIPQLDGTLDEGSTTAEED